MSAQAHLRGAVFLKDYRVFRAKDQLDFRAGINLLVGDQGCGKSSLLRLLAALGGLGSEKHMREEAQRTLLIDVDSVRAGYFDFEKHNPRIQPALGMGYGYDDRFQLSCMFRSHGEFARPYIEGAMSLKGPALIMWDEPEGGLSLRSAYKLADGLLAAAERGVQWVVATHHPVLIEAAGEVLSLEHKRWMSAADFVASQKTAAGAATSPAPKRRARRRDP